MATLYELTNEYRTLYDMAEDPDMEEQFDMWLDTMEGLEGELAAKLEGYTMVMKSLEADAAGIKKEEERLYSRRQTITHRIERMKQRMQDAMNAVGQKNMKSNLFSFTIQKNPASVVIDNEAEIPRGYYIPQPDKLDKAALKDFLSGLGEGETVPYAHLAQTESLRIR